jgi:hypothetical protein
MADETPGQTPEGRLIEKAAKASGRSIRALAANAGMSDTRWRQVVRGYQQNSSGITIEARATPQTLARMAISAGVTPGELEEAGREDAAEQQRRILNQMATDSVAPLPVGAPGQQSDEIDMIVASNMTAREKLLRIRQVLELRAQADADELRTAGQQQAPADEAGARVEQQG